jgi:periplasmic divalent cation tolerance protein
MNKNTFIQVITTSGSRSDAESIANVLLDKRLAACVQIAGPIQSHYHWKGNRETSEEWLCLVKTREDLYQQVENAIKHTHPYDVPEIIAVPIIAGSAEYLKWLEKETMF